MPFPPSASSTEEKNEKRENEEMQRVRNEDADAAGLGGDKTMNKRGNRTGISSGKQGAQYAKR